MIKKADNADQLVYWSVTDGKIYHSVLKTKTNRIAETPPTHRVISSAWLIDRAIQTLRKPTLSLCPRSWAWSQVLSFHQRTEKPSLDDLCATSLQRQRQTSTFILSRRAPPSHSTRRNQSRTATTARKTLTIDHEFRQSKRRFLPARRLYRQYDDFMPTRPSKERRP